MQLAGIGLAVRSLSTSICDLASSMTQGARDTSYSLELSHNRRASVTDFKAELRVDLREHYEV